MLGGLQWVGPGRASRLTAERASLYRRSRPYRGGRRIIHGWRGIENIVSYLGCYTVAPQAEILEFLSPAERFSFKIFIPLYGAPQAQKNLVFLSFKALCMKNGLTFLGTRGAVGLPTAPAPAPRGMPMGYILKT